MQIHLKSVFLGLIFLLPLHLQAQDDRVLSTRLEVGRIRSEIELAEREVELYNKDIRLNKRRHERMKDRADRLKYKAARSIADLDTTVARKMTYAEWQLIKAEGARDKAAGAAATARQARELRILLLADKTKELQQAKGRAYESQASYAEREREANTKPGKVPDKRDMRKDLR